MRTLILGGTGMLGQALSRAARGRGQAVLALSRGQADIMERERLRYWMETFRPELVINCAAFTRVDACEGDGREHAAGVNGRAVAHVAEAAGRIRARLLHLSTDYVFDGSAREPYREDAATGPLSVYGQSKLEGEQHALAYERSLVVRTSWLFGPGGPNFVATIVDQIEKGQRPLRVVEDQLGAPTYTPFLAEALLDLAPLPAGGVVHYRNREPVSWYAFAGEISRFWTGPADRVPLVPVATAQFPRPAPRPFYSVLAVDRVEELLGRRVDSWERGLAEYLDWMRTGRSR